MKGSLNRSQQKLVNYLFYLLDKNSSGFIEEDELRCFFQEALLRDVVFDYTTPSVQSKEFVNLCGCKEKISLENFTEHYISKSLRFDDDSTFESEVMKEWHLRDEDLLFYPSQHLVPSGRSVSCARKLSLNSQQARLEKIDITDRNGESNGTVFLIRNRGRATSMPSIATEINSISRRQIVIDKIKKQISGVAMQENDPEDPFNAIAVVTNEEASLLPCIENEMKAASVRTIVPFQGVTKAGCSYSSQNTVDEKSSESVMAALSDAMITINNEVKALQNISSYLESLISQHDTIIDNQSKLIDDFQTSLGWIKLL